MSAAMASVISAVLASMVMFGLEGHSTAKRKHLWFAWIPWIISDWAVIAFIIGLVLWYGEKNSGWRTALCVGQAGVLWIIVALVAPCMWFALSQSGETSRDPEIGMAKSHSSCYGVQASPPLSI